MPATAALDPDVAALAERFARAGVEASDRIGVIAARAQLERVTRLQPPKAEVAEVREVLLPGGAGMVPARVYHPAPGRLLPVVLYVHGGGWVMGSVEASDGPCRDLVVATDCVVVSLAYRLAPETPFPGAFEDCVAAACGLIDGPGQVGGADGPIVLAGDSAGGNLAAATTIALRGLRPGAVGAQMLLYPCLSPARDSRFASYTEHADAPLMTARELEWFWDLYLQRPDDLSDPRAVPLRTEDLSGLPATTILLAGHDPLRDEGLAYAERLRQAGVPVTLRVWEGQSHGFWWMAEALQRARSATATLAESIRRAFDA